MRYTLRQLEIFVAISQTESISRACEQLALSQSATSTALMELEKQCQTPLFDRVGKSLRMNELGKQLRPKALVLLDQAKEIELLLQGNHRVGYLNIGATLTIGNYLATLLVARFLRMHPTSQVDLKVDNTVNIVQRIAQHTLDLGLIEGECHHPDIHVTPWIADELVAFAAPNHPLAKQAQISRSALLSQPWILRELGSGTRETFNRGVGADYSRLNIQLTLEHTEAIKRAVEAGLGIGCLSRLALKEAFARGSLVALECDELSFKRQFYFVWRKQKYQTTSMRLFLALCHQLTTGVARSDLIDLRPLMETI